MRPLKKSADQIGQFRADHHGMTVQVWFQDEARFGQQGTLTPYSPQLNPIEKLWQYLRQHHWSNRVYEGYDHLRQAASQAWHKVCLNPEKIKSICRAKYVEHAFI